MRTDYRNILHPVKRQILANLQSLAIQGVENVRMAAITARELLAANVARLMEADPGFDTPEKLAKVARWPAGRKKGELVAPRTIRYLLDTREETIPPVPSPSLDLIVAIANVFKKQAWELLVDDEQARRWVMSKIWVEQPAANDRLEQSAPPFRMQSPKRMAAKRKHK